MNQPAPGEHNPLDLPAVGEEEEGASFTSGGHDRRMLEALICPVTQAQLIYDAASQELISRPAGLAFPIRNAIPIMLVDEARKLD